MKHLLILVSLYGLLASPAATGQQPAPAVATPGDVKPGSITCEDVPYPYPSSYLPLTLYGQDVRMAYMDVAPQGQPNGHTVVLLHGNNFAGFYFGGPIDALRKQGFRVIVPDQIGYGRSSKPIIPYNLNDMARNTRAILQSLKIDRVMIIGHSMGGMLATRFATQYPDIAERVVLYNPIGLVDTRFARPSDGVDEGYKRTLGATYPTIRASLMRYVAHNPGAWNAQFEAFARIRYSWTLSADWPRLAMVQTLLGQGDISRSRCLRLGPHQGADAAVRRRRRRAARISRRLQGADEVRRRNHPERQRPAALDSRPRPRPASGGAGENLSAADRVSDRRDRDQVGGGVFAG